VSDGKVTSERLKAAARRALTVLDGPSESASDATAVVAQWPEAVAALTPSEREERVRRGADTVLLDTLDDAGRRQTRGFLRVVLRVPVGHPEGQAYGAFVELDREGYAALKRAHQMKEPTRVWARLANRFPLLEEAFDSEVLVEEDGSERRARVVEARHRLLVDGPEVGPLGRSR